MEKSIKKNDNITHFSGKSRRKTGRIHLHIIRKIVLLLFAMFLIAVFFGLGMLKGILDSTPPLSSFNFGPEARASIILDRNGKEMATLVKEGSNRLIASVSEIKQNKHLINAFVAIEDERFFEHTGIDINSIFRAIYGVLTSDESRGGGSTITQQLIKNSVFDAGQNEKGLEKYVRKIQEQYIALQYESQVSGSRKEFKEQILTDYLNMINLGANTLGIKVAAKRYFNKDIKDLTISECAVIASITKNPTKNNPITHPEENAKRRRQVLLNMQRLQYITDEEYEIAIHDDVYNRIENNEVRINSSNQVYSYFTDALLIQVENDLLKLPGWTKEMVRNQLYAGGLTIYTTQDPDIQKVVDKEINDDNNYTVKKYSIDYRLSIRHKDDTQTHYSQVDIDKYQKDIIKNKKYDGLYSNKNDIDNIIKLFKQHIMKDGDSVAAEVLNYILEPQCSFVLIDHKTSEVLALNGGRGEKKMSRTLNRAYGTYRQPGSTFKVLTSFAPALELFDKTLATVYYDSEYVYKEKTFKNWYSSGFLGFQNIRSGIIYSLNLVAVRCLMETVTPEGGVEFAKKFGISSLSKEDYNPASALGGITRGVSNIELTNAFATIANKGNHIDYKLYTKILDKDNNVLIDNTSNKSTSVLSPANAYLLTDAMKQSMEGNKAYSGTITVNSTSTSARFSKMSLAGKSGTTSNNNDVWFVGFSPYYTAGIWAGCDENQTLYDSKKKINNGGTSFHKSIWKKIMQELHKNKTNVAFEKPNNIISRTVCRKSGLLATDGCKSDARGDCSYSEYFVDGTQPTKHCSFHNSNGTVNIPNKYSEYLTDDSYFQDFNNMVVPNVPSENTVPVINAIPSGPQ